MGWRRALLSAQAAARRAERDHERAQRQAERDYKRGLREQEIRASARAAASHETFIEALTGAHRHATEEIDWKEIHDAEPPQPQLRTSANESAARKKHDAYRPTFFDTLFGRTERKQTALLEEIRRAREQDESAFVQARAKFGLQMEEWESLHSIAERILADDTAAFLEALKEFQEDVLKGMSITGLEFEVYSSGQVVANLDVHPLDFVPRDNQVQLKTGKLSTRPYPKGEYHRIYSDYVCGSALRVAREVLAILPCPRVFVNVKTKLLDPTSGKLTDQMILSIAFPRESLTEFEWENVDPTFALDKVNHASGLRKLQPPAAVQPLVTPK